MRLQRRLWLLREQKQPRRSKSPLQLPQQAKTRRERLLEMRLTMIEHVEEVIEVNKLVSVNGDSYQEVYFE